MTQSVFFPSILVLATGLVAFGLLWLLSSMLGGRTAIRPAIDDAVVAQGIEAGRCVFRQQRTMLRQLRRRARGLPNRDLLRTG